MNPLFPLGRVVITRTARDTLDPASVASALQRHANGDRGELSEEDLLENERALNEGCRLLSAYTDSGDTRFWIITEWNRSLRTILLPEDY